MGRLTVLCFASFLLSSCGVNEADLRQDLASSFERIADAIVEELGGSESLTNNTPELTPLGDARVVELEIGGSPDTGNVGTYTTTTFRKWGYWGQLVSYEASCTPSDNCIPVSEETLFRTHLDTAVDRSIITMVQGTQSGRSPESGSAVWLGGVRAYQRSLQETISYWQVHGDARLEVDFTAATVDVDFTNLSNEQAGMSWSGLTLDNGVFGYGTTSIEGSFYGANHHGAAGKFARDELTGVFGAIRTAEAQAEE